ncbi:MAG: hypothetical protein WBF90_15500 [Rivularia sp. (in: cyanobacteria)]|jgi:hypothetical protein
MGFSSGWGLATDGVWQRMFWILDSSARFNLVTSGLIDKLQSITNYQLPTNNQQLPITNYQLPTNN